MTNATEYKVNRVIERAVEEVRNGISEYNRIAEGKGLPAEVSKDMWMLYVTRVESEEQGFVKGYINALREAELINDEEREQFIAIAICKLSY